MRVRRRSSLALCPAFGLAVVLITTRQGALRAHDSRSGQAEAAAQFDRGVALVNRGDLLGGLRAFERAYELTSEPRVLLNIGLLRIALGQPVEALDALERLVEARPLLDAEQETTVRRETARLRPLVARLTVLSNVAGTFAIDGVLAGVAPTTRPRLLVPGRYELRVSAPGHEPVIRAIVVQGGTTTNVTVTLVPARPGLAGAADASSYPGRGPVPADRTGQPWLGGALVAVGLATASVGLWSLAADWDTRGDALRGRTLLAESIHVPGAPCDRAAPMPAACAAMVDDINEDVRAAERGVVRSAAIASIGLAVGAAGVALLLARRDRVETARPGRRSASAVRLWANGSTEGLLGVGGQF